VAAKPVRPAVRRTDPEAQGNGAAPEDAPPPKPEPYTRLPIAVSLTGSYKDYQEFLFRLKQFPKIIAVDRVQLRPRLDLKTATGSPKLEVDMQLTAFILKEAPGAGPITAAPEAVPTSGAPSQPA
jgi:Tfp pilus assembly protein PilO